MSLVQLLRGCNNNEPNLSGPLGLCDCDHDTVLLLRKLDLWLLAITSHADLALCRLHCITLMLLKIDLTLFFLSLLSGTDVGCGA